MARKGRTPLVSLYPEAASIPIYAALQTGVVR